jgi:hypothetical protein
MSRGPARRASFKASRYSAWRCGAWRTAEYAERSAPVLGRAERTPARPSRCARAETGDSACFRIASRWDRLRRPRRFPVRSKREPRVKSTGGLSLLSENGRRGIPCPPGHPAMTDRRRRGRGISVRFRSVSPLKACRQSFKAFEARSQAL